MVVLVRCTDQSISVALQSKLDLLLAEGLITAYLTPEGWVSAEASKPCPAPTYMNRSPRSRCSRCTAFVSCF